MVRMVRPAVVRIETSTGSGSGAIYETHGQTAYVITNEHVVRGEATVTVTVNDTTEYQGTVLGTDPARDLAVVHICCRSFSKLSFGNANELEAGDEVVTIGYALGLTGQASITRGIVSAIRYDPALLSNVIQTDAATNPGSSGGPLLSIAGKILGINTYRIDYSGSGRAAENLGFAISGSTVQARIPALQSAAPAPTPPPTRRATATPTPYQETTGFGPVDGALWHDPSDELIKADYANIQMEDLIVKAIFTNPYLASQSNSWDYGLIFRDDGESYLQAIVTSDGAWEVGKRKDRKSNTQTIESGKLSNFNTGAGQRNEIWLAAAGTHGILIVNAEFVALIDLPATTSRTGAIAVITGVYKGNQVAGAVTKYEDFRISQLSKEYEHAGGHIPKTQGAIDSQNSGVWSRDLVAEVTFTTPPGNQWSYGFIIRNSESNRLEVLGFNSWNSWFHKTKDTQDSVYTDVSEEPLKLALHPENHLMVLALSNFGMLLVNGEFVSQLDLSHNLDHGYTGAMSNFYTDHDTDTSFKDFRIWVPP